MLRKTIIVMAFGLGAGILFTAGCTPQKSMLAGSFGTAVCRSADATVSPSVIYEKMTGCVRQHNYDLAVMLYAQAGSYSWYDAIQADSEAARQQHHALLRAALEQLNETQREAFWQRLSQTMKDASALSKICRQVTALGPPRYRSDFTMQDTARADDQPLWQRAVNNYLHCT